MEGRLIDFLGFHSAPTFPFQSAGECFLVVARKWAERAPSLRLPLSRKESARLRRPPDSCPRRQILFFFLPSRPSPSAALLGSLVYSSIMPFTVSRISSPRSWGSFFLRWTAREKLFHPCPTSRTGMAVLFVDVLSTAKPSAARRRCFLPRA